MMCKPNGNLQRGGLQDRQWLRGENRNSREVLKRGKELLLQTSDRNSTFHTKLIPPGRHKLIAEAYARLTDQHRISTGFMTPGWRVKTTVEVPQTGDVIVPDLELMKAR